jgi:hypothetical protein
VLNASLTINHITVELKKPIESKHFWRWCDSEYYWLAVWDLRFSRRWLWRMVSSGMLRRVALVRTDVSEELSISFIRVTRIGELGRLLVNS